MTFGVPCWLGLVDSVSSPYYTTIKLHLLYLFYVLDHHSDIMDEPELLLLKYQVNVALLLFLCLLVCKIQVSSEGTTGPLRLI